MALQPLCAPLCRPQPALRTEGRLHPCLQLQLSVNKRIQVWDTVEQSIWKLAEKHGQDPFLFLVFLIFNNSFV